MSDPEKQAQLIESLKDGNKPVVTLVSQDGQEQKLRVEAIPRFSNLNFFQLNGRIEKREQFLKDPAQDLSKGSRTSLIKSWTKRSSSRDKACLPDL